MANIVISGDTSGSVTLSAPAVSGTTVLTLPTTSGTLVTTAGGSTVPFALGSAAAPSITFTGDTNTGMFSPGADTIAFAEGGVESMRIDSSGNVGIGTSSPAFKLQVNGGAVTQLGVETTSGVYYNRLIASQTFAYSGIEYASLFNFADGSTERMRIDSAGSLLVGGTSGVGGISSKLVVVSSDLFNNFAGIGIKNNTNNTGGYFAYFVNSSNSTIGSISQSTSTTVAYNTSSDYRLKENIAPMTGALDKIAQLKPCTYTWKENGSNGQGFIAHELQAVVPDCVTGEKDAVDEEGKPIYQGIDTSFLVATLTAAIQELNAKVTALEAQLGAK